MSSRKTSSHPVKISWAHAAEKQKVMLMKLRVYRLEFGLRRFMAFCSIGFETYQRFRFLRAWVNHFPATIIRECLEFGGKEMNYTFP